MESLQLLPLQISEAPDLYRLVDTNREQLHKFWWEPGTQSVQDSINFIEAVNQEERKNGAPTRGIYESGRLIGVAALHTIDWQARRSLMGYWIDSKEAGKGYTTAAARALVELAFDGLQLEELRIVARETNRASRRIAEKLGFTLLSVSDHVQWQDERPDDMTATYSLKNPGLAAAELS